MVDYAAFVVRFFALFDFATAAVRLPARLRRSASIISTTGSAFGWLMGVISRFFRLASMSFSRFTRY